jgi:hypothetical protein
MHALSPLLVTLSHHSTLELLYSNKMSNLLVLSAAILPVNKNDSFLTAHSAKDNALNQYLYKVENIKRLAQKSLILPGVQLVPKDKHVQESSHWVRIGCDISYDFCSYTHSRLSLSRNL